MPFGEATASVETDAAHLKKLRREKAICMSPCRVRLAGLATRLIAVPLMIEMVVAMLSTKISLFLGTSPLPLPPAPPTIGIWAVLHEVRSEWAQLLVCSFLLRAGPGRLSLDALLARGPSRSSARRLSPAIGG